MGWEGLDLAQDREQKDFIEAMIGDIKQWKVGFYSSQKTRERDRCNCYSFVLSSEDVASNSSLNFNRRDFSEFQVQNLYVDLFHYGSKYLTSFFGTAWYCILLWLIVLGVLRVSHSYT